MFFPLWLLPQMVVFLAFNHIGFFVRQLPDLIYAAENRSESLLTVKYGDKNMLWKSGSAGAGGDDGDDDDGLDTPGNGWWAIIEGEDELFLRKMKDLMDYIPPEKLTFSYKQSINGFHGTSCATTFKRILWHLHSLLTSELSFGAKINYQRTSGGKQFFLRLPNGRLRACGLESSSYNNILRMISIGYKLEVDSFFLACNGKMMVEGDVALAESCVVVSIRVRGGGKRISSEEDVEDLDESNETFEDESYCSDASDAAEFTSDSDTYIDKENHHGVVKDVKRKTTLKSRAEAIECIAADMRKSRCQKNCLTDVIKKEEFTTLRKKFWKKDQEAQRAYILQYFDLCLRRDGSMQFVLNSTGNVVCRKAWLTTLNISNGRFYNLLRDFKNGRTSPVSAKCAPARPSCRRMRAEAWLRKYAETCGDKMPDVDKIALPSCLTKKEVYKTYMEEERRKTNDPVSEISFLRLWKSNLKNVYIPKQSRFTKCGVCVLLSEYCQKTESKTTRLSLMERKRIHLRQQMAERKEYYRRCLMSESEPKKYLSIIMDGMDQSKTNLPHATQTSKVDELHFLKTHITGVISHGHQRVFTFLDLLRWPHDSNLTLNILLKVFLKLAKVFLSYLMVGHTHEDIDQMFSGIADALQRHSVMTIPELQQLIKGCYSPSPETNLIHFLYDITEWLAPHIDDIKGHVYPHSFKFAKDDSGKVGMWYKQWAKEEEWLPKDGPLYILKSVPKGIPPIIRPHSKRIPSAEDMKSKLSKSACRMNTNQIAWWNSFIKLEEKYKPIWEEASPNTLQKIKATDWPFLSLKKHLLSTELEDVGPTDVEEQHMEEQLNKLLKKQNHFPQIQVGSKRKPAARESEKGKSVKKTRKTQDTWQNDQGKKNKRRLQLKIKQKSRSTTK